MSKYYLIFGGIAGAISALLEYFLYKGVFGFDSMAGVIYGKILALVVCIVFGVVLIKKLNGGISFLRTSFSGLMIAIVCSTFSGIGYSMMHYPDGSFFNEAKEYAYDEWIKTNKDNPEEMAKISEVKSAIESRFTVMYHSALEFGLYLVVGVVFTAFFAGFIADRNSLAG